jgi:protein-disulfide isomerase/uncharacterized membrane protein
VKGRAASAALLVLALVGLIDASFLVWDHQIFLLDPSSDAGICQRGGGCEISRISYWSEVPLGSARPGLPIALLGGAFYFALVILVLRRLSRPTDARPLRIVTLTSLGALAYSVVLAGVSFGAQGTLCPYCAVLYAVNLLLVVITVASSRERLVDTFRHGPASAFSGVGISAAAAFVIALVGGYAIYAAPLFASQDSRHERLLAAASKLGESPVTPLVTEGRPSIGPGDAPIHIVEVADLECPYCKRLFVTLHELARSQPDRIRLSFMHYPLDSTCNPLLAQPFHQDACRLAVAAECAHRDGKFFELAGWLFEAGAKVTREAIVEHAGALGLDSTAFAACLDDPAVVETIRADISRGAEAGVQGTPNFFINGHHVVGGRDRDVIEKMMESVAPSAPPAGAGASPEGGGRP